MNTVNAIPDTIPGLMLAVGRRVPELAAMQSKKKRGYRSCTDQQLGERAPPWSV
jgi:hypothetical protein